MDTARVEPSQTQITIDVAIPALNEEGCIEGLLDDVMMAQE
ncbi:hypothetical protein ACFLWG_00480 [Chloroflexota bacterium]